MGQLIASPLRVPPAGGRFGGCALLLLDGKPMYAHAYTNQDGEKYPHQNKDKSRVTDPDKLTPGKHTITLDFKHDGGGSGKGGLATLSVDGKTVAEARIDKTPPVGKYSLD